MAEKSIVWRSRGSPDDPLDLRQEAHVEHPVGLVEDEDPDAVERDQAALDEIVQPARRRDDDLGAAQPLRLRGDGCAAVDGRDAEPARRAERRQLLGHLQRELAGRGEARAPPGRGSSVEMQLDDREPEGERLAGAGRRLAEDVAAGERVGDDERLDAERLVDAAGG